MATAIRLGLIGASEWAEFAFLQPLVGWDRASIVAVCARNEQRRQQVADTFGIKQTFSDWRELIASCDLDGVIVATPDGLHHDIAVAAMDAGLGVLCEKPLGRTVVETAHMVASAARAGVVNHVMFTYRGKPHYRFIKDELSQLGRVLHCALTFRMGYARNEDYFWRLDGNNGDGARGDLAVHMVDLAQWLVGDIDSATTTTGHYFSRYDNEGHAVPPVSDWAHVTMHFATGATGTVEASLVADLGQRAMEQSVAIFCEGGSLECTVGYYTDGQGQATIVRNRGGVSEDLTIPERYVDGDPERTLWSPLRFANTGVRAFAMALAGEYVDAPTFAAGHSAQVVINS